MCFPPLAVKSGLIEFRVFLQRNAALGSRTTPQTRAFAGEAARECGKSTVINLIASEEVPPRSYVLKCGDEILHRIKYLK